MNCENKPVTPSIFNKTAGYLKDGGGYDVAVAALAAAHGVPVPPSVIKRFRTGMGRLIDGSFDLLAGGLARKNARSDFDAKLQQTVVKALAQAGTSNLAQNSPDISTTVALSMLNEYGLKFDNKAAAAQYAFEELANGPPLQEEVSDTDIDVDWLNFFSDIAAQKSNPEMQRLMGKILAGEIRKPGSFSPMTIQVLATLTPAVAQKFEQLCSVAVEISSVNSILLNVFPEFLTNGIPEIGFTYMDLLALRSHQLLASEAGSTWSMEPGATVFIPACERNFELNLMKTSSKQHIPVALFSQTGIELRRLVSPILSPILNQKLPSIFTQPTWNLIPL